MEHKKKVKKSRIASVTGIKVLFVLATLVLTGIGLTAVFSSTLHEESRTTHPPGQPKNPSPADDATGLLGSTISLSWQQSEVYRGNHKDIDNTWLKVSTNGPCNSDSANGNIFDGQIGPSSNYQISGSKVTMGSTYYWAVKCHDEEGWGQYSNWKFSTNALPIASITSITPSQVREGCEVEFVGEGVDNVDNDDIINFEWASDIDGILSDSRTFSSMELEGPLTPGIHHITLKVQDENELWSEITDQCERILEVQENTAPSMPHGIKVDGDSLIDDNKLTTHKLQPRITWNPSSDPDPEDDNSISYVISISATNAPLDHSIANEVPVVLPEYTITDVSLSYGNIDPYSNTMSNTYYIEIHSTDGFKQSEVSTAEFKVINHPPGKPDIKLLPEEPTGSDLIFCEITMNGPNPSEDEDGDRIKYTYSWYKNGRFQDQYSGEGVEYGQIPKDAINHFDTWKVKVTPNDGYVDGESNQAEVLIGNQGPNIVLAITEAEFPEEGYYCWEKITFDATATTDPDGDYISDNSYIWTSNISGDLGRGAFFEPVLSPGTHEITLEITDEHNAASSITRIIEVLRSPYHIIPQWVYEPIGKVKVDDKIGPITFWIHNRGSETLDDLTIKLVDDGNVVTSVAPVKVSSLGANTSYPFIIEEYKITGQTVKLTVLIEGNTSKGKALSAERGEIIYNKDSYMNFTATTVDKPSVEKESGNWFGNNGHWIVLIILVILIIIGIVLWVQQPWEEDSEDPVKVDSTGMEGELQGGYPTHTSSLEPMKVPFGKLPGMDQFPHNQPGMPPKMPPMAFLPPPSMYHQEQGWPMFGGQLALPAGNAPTMLPQQQYMGASHSLPGISEFQQPPHMQQQPSLFSFNEPSLNQAPTPFSGGMAPQRPEPNIKPKIVPTPTIGSETKVEIPENEEPACPNCDAKVQKGWLLCPECKSRLK